MLHLMKSKWYQLTKEKLLWIAFAVTLFLQFTSMNGELSDGFSSNVCRFIVEFGQNMQLIAMLFAVVATAIITGGDFMDKTFNYEVLSGHTRAEIFFSKTILSVLVGMVGYIFILVVPVLIAGNIYEFGNELDQAELMIRVWLSAIVTLRIICASICFTYMVKIPYITMGAGFLMFEIGPLLTTFMSDNKSCLLGITCYNRLTEFESWMTYTMGNSMNIITVYGHKMAGKDFAEIIISTILMGAIMLLVGYSYFKRDDVL